MTNGVLMGNFPYLNSSGWPVVTPTILCTLLPMMSKVNNLPLETEPVVSNNNTAFMLKPGDQPFIMP